MDQKTGDFLTKKNKLEKEMATIIFESAESGKINPKDIRPIAKEILLEFEKVTNDAQLMLFLEKIKNKWDFFSHLYSVQKGNLQVDKEKQIIEKLSQYIKQSN